MLPLLIFVAAGTAQSYGTLPPSRTILTAPAAKAGAKAGAAPRALAELPGTTITYYDIAGKSGPAIEKSLKKRLADPNAKDSVRLFSWDVATQIMKATTGTSCVVQSASAKLSATVRLPRLAEEAKVPKDVLVKWQRYVKGVENEAATYLWFISDRLRGAERMLVGLACAQANTAWANKLNAVRTDLNAFMVQRAQAAKTSAGEVVVGESVM